MIRVVLQRFGDPDPMPTWLDEGTLAVAAEPYAALDEGQAGVTRGDIKDADIKTLDQFEPGAEVFLESDDPTDVLDDTDEVTERAAKIFWRATIGERGGR
jgi:hypothetical protein